MKKIFDLKKVISLLSVFTVTALGWIVFSMYIYQEDTYEMSEYISEECLHDFALENGIITSTSWDPWIMLRLDNKCVKTVDIEISNLSEEGISASICTGGHRWVWDTLSLCNGVNSASFHFAWDSLSYLRLDLAEQADVSMSVGRVVINNHSKILRIALREAILLALGITFFYLMSMMLCVKSCKTAIDHVKNLLNSFVEKLIINKNVKEFWKFTLKVWVVYIVAILAILKADFLYIDDLGRSYTGSVADWDTYSRYIAEFVCKVMSSDSIVTDTSPLSQIITMFFMAISVAIVVKCLMPQKIKNNWLVIASVPFAISPYFMENISYKIESIMHGTTVLFSIMPLLLYKKRNWQYLVFTALCISCMCTTYQGGTGVFPVVIIMLSAIEWNRGVKIGEIWKLIWKSIAGYGIGLASFRLFIMKPVSTHVSSDLLPIDEMISGFMHNILTYYSIVFGDFKILWLVLIMLIIGCFVVLFTVNSIHGKFISFIIAWLVVGAIAILTHGIYPLLVQCVYEPRHMFTLGITISLFCIYIVANGAYFSKFFCLALGWCFITFSFTYGNCLVLQKEYTSVKAQSVINYINENYESGKYYTLELQNYIGLAPSIINKTENCGVLGKLIPQTLGGGWSWSEYKIYSYYGLPSNFKTVWAWDKGDEDIPSAKNLPLKDTTVWFDVYGDDDDILISFK